MEKQEKFIERLARRQGITVEVMRDQIALRIKEGLKDSESNHRLQWEQIPHTGDMPTPEEYLDYALMRIYEEEREDLLRQYLIE